MHAIVVNTVPAIQAPQPDSSLSTVHSATNTVTRAAHASSAWADVALSATHPATTQIPNQPRLDGSPSDAMVRAAATTASAASRVQPTRPRRITTVPTASATRASATVTAAG